MVFKKILSLIVATLFFSICMVSAQSSVYADLFIEYTGPSAYGSDGPGLPLGNVDPESVVLGPRDERFLSLLPGSEVTLGFSNIQVIDGPGDDIRLLEHIAGNEAAKIYIQTASGSFKELGDANSGGKLSFDLADITYNGGVSIFKIVGLSEGGASPGFDLDAMEALNWTSLANELIVDSQLELFPDAQGKASDFILLNNKFFGRDDVTIDRIELATEAFSVVSASIFNNLRIEGTNVRRMDISYDSNKGNEKSAELIIYHDGANSPSIVQLSVPNIEEPQALSISNGNLSFYYACEGERTVESFIVTNTSERDIDFTFDLASLNEFIGQIELNTSTFKANGETLIEVTYTADRFEERSTQTPELQLITADTILVKDIFVLRSNGTLNAPTEVVLTPNADGTAEDTIYLSSSSGSTQIIDLQDNSSNFVFEFLSNDCISSDEQIGVVIFYDPNVGNDQSTILTIENNGATPKVEILVQVKADEAIFEYSKEELTFIYLKPEQSYGRSFYLRNVGGSNGILNSLVTTSDDFRILAPQINAPIIIASGDSIKIEIEYNPKSIITTELLEELKIETSTGSNSILLNVPCSKGELSSDFFSIEFDPGNNTSVAITLSLFLRAFGNGDPVIITDLKFVENIYFKIVDPPSLPLCIEEGETIGLTISGMPEIVFGEKSFEDDQLIIEMNGGGNCRKTSEVYLKAIGDFSAYVSSISPRRSPEGIESDVVISGTGFDDVVDVYFVNEGKRYELINEETRTRDRIEATIPIGINPGLYDLLIVSRNEIHPDLTLERAYTIYSSISGIVYDIDINLNTGQDRPPRPLANSEVIIRATEKGERLGSGVTGPDGRFDIEVEEFKNFMWIEASILPTPSNDTIPSILQSIQIQPFVRSTDYELLLPRSIVNDIYARLPKLEKVEVEYSLPLLSPIVARKVTNSAYEIDPIIESMMGENLFENRCCQGWKNESLERIALGLKSMKDHMDLMSQLSPELSTSMTKLLFELYSAYSGAQNLRQELISQNVAISKELSTLGIANVGRRTALYAQHQFVSVMEKFGKFMLKILIDFIKKGVDRTILSSFPDNPENKAWKDSWNASFSVIQKLLFADNLRSGTEDIGKSLLQDAIVLGIDQTFRTAYFSYADQAVTQVGALVGSGNSNQETFESEVVKYNQLMTTQENSVNDIIDLTKNLDETGGALKTIADVNQKLALLGATLSGGSLIPLSLQLYAVGETLKKINLATMAVIPILISSEMVSNHNSLSNSLEDLRKADYSILISELISMAQMEALQVQLDNVLRSNSLKGGAGEQTSSEVYFQLLNRIEQLWDIPLSNCSDPQCIDALGKLQKIKNEILSRDLLYMRKHTNSTFIPTPNSLGITPLFLELQELLAIIYANTSVDSRLNFTYYLYTEDPVLRDETNHYSVDILSASTLDIEPSRLTIMGSESIDIKEVTWSQDDLGWRAQVDFISTCLTCSNWIEIQDLKSLLPDQIEPLWLSVPVSQFKIGKNEGFQFFPNPAENQIIIRSNTGSLIEFVHIYNANGQLIRSHSFQQVSGTVSVQDLKTGLYFIEVEDGNGLNIQKFIKTN